MKKLLGLLAVAPMAIAACGGTTEKEIDRTVAETGVAYGATHGLEIKAENVVTIGWETDPVSAEDATEDKPETVGAKFEMPFDDLGVADCTETPDVAGIDAIELTTIGQWNDFDITGSITLEDGSAGTCAIDVASTITYKPNENTMVTSGLSMAEAKLNADGQLVELKLDETARIAGTGANAGRNVYVVEEKYVPANMDVYGYRTLTAVEAADFIAAYTQAVGAAPTYKHGTDYMPVDGDAKGWTKSIDALMAYLDGKNLEEVKKAYMALKDGTAGDWTNGAAGASENFKHAYHYAAVVVEAMENAVAVAAE